MPPAPPPPVVQSVLTWVEQTLAVLFPPHDYDVAARRSSQGLWVLRATLSHAAYDDLYGVMATLRNSIEACVSEFGHIHAPPMQLALKRRT